MQKLPAQKSYHPQYPDDIVIEGMEDIEQPPTRTAPQENRMESPEPQEELVSQ